MRYYLGLDGGGTKTATVILGEPGHELGRGRGGPCNIATSTDEQLRASVSEAVTSALSAAGLPADTRFTAACAGVAGYTAKRRRAEFAELLADVVGAERYCVEADFTIAYWGATAGEPGIVVSAGTGAVVFGRNAQGEECRMDGRGFLLGDSGSGFDLGKRVLSDIVHGLDEGMPATGLYREVMQRLQLEDADDIVEWTYREFSPSRIAAVAEIVADLAAEGDEMAVFFLQGQGGALRHSYDRVAAKLRMEADSPAYLLGSVWTAGDPIVNAFTRADLRSPDAPPPLRTASPRHDAAYGAALLALKAAERPE